MDFEIFWVALRNLRYQGLRSYLTLLGVIIGIAAIVALLSISQGLNASVEAEFESLGTDTIFIIPLASQSGSTTENLKLRDVDLRRIESFPEVRVAIPFFTTRARIEKGTQKITGTVLGADPEKSGEIQSAAQIGEGRDIGDNEVFAALLGYDFAENAFDRPLSAKSSIEIEGRKFRIVGILEETSTSVGGGPNFNNSVLITEKAYKIISDDDSPGIVFARTYAPEDADLAAEKIDKYLERKFGENNFLVSTAGDLLEAFNAIFGVLSLFLLGVAGISLVVGGVGIMNAMVTAALERTKEIGIMKAIGATENTIMGLFLIESGFIGLVGGLIGLVIGYVAALIISALAQGANFNLQAILPIEIALGVLAFSMLVGMLSGIYPARRAAKLDPVEALRYE
ncbi:MAG: ABC transporter permease [Candidatus Diapherotrites archaeon]